MAHVFDLAGILKDAAKMDDTIRSFETIERIPLEQLVEDEKNFYSLEGIEALAQNIELCGLMDPIRVRPMGDMFRIVSGHRRTAAIRKLTEEGCRMFEDGIPAIREKEGLSEAMQELRLIYANKDTRRMTGADLQKQSERVTELLYQLQEQGVEFPGRMRDHVAEAVGVSKTKIARLNAIKNNLDSSLYEHFESGAMNETVAYELSKLDQYEQRYLVKDFLDSGYKIGGLTENLLKFRSDTLQKVRKIKCDEGMTDGVCVNTQKRFHEATKDLYCYAPCTSKCCKDCERLYRCKNSCEFAEDAKKKMAGVLAEEKERQEAERVAKYADDVEIAKVIWERVHAAREEKGLSPMDVLDIIHKYSMPEKEIQSYVKTEKGLKSPLENTVIHTPFGYSMQWEEIKRMRKIASTLGLSIDYMLAFDNPEEDGTEDCKIDNPMAPKFFESFNPPDGKYYCRLIVDDNEPMYMLLERKLGQWRMVSGCEVHESVKVTGWWPVPEVDS